MIEMLKQLWSMLTVLFSAGEDAAYAIKAVSEYSREGAESFRDEARLERKAQYDDLQRRLKEAGIEQDQALSLPNQSSE